MNDSIISWGERTGNTYDGVISREEERSYYIYHSFWNGVEMYSLYERDGNALVCGDECWNKDDHIAYFKHLEKIPIK